MSKWQKHFPLGYMLFMRIAEPRMVRLLHFGIYISMISAGWGITAYPPSAFKDVLGWVLVMVFGLFLLLGGVLGAISVLPGIWWLERVSLICLITGMSVYTVVILDLHASPVGISISVAFVLTFVLRWIGIRRYQLAPREE